MPRSPAPGRAAGASGTGSDAFVWPASHRDVPLISESLIEQMIPVRQTKSARKHSMLYSTRGVAVHVPRHIEIPA
jgi:hypothetical protein